MTKIERKRHGPHGAQTAWFYQYLAKGLHKEKNGKRTDHNTTHPMDLVNFSLFILSYLINSDFELWGDSLQELTYLMPFHIFMNTCLPHGEPCSIKNLTLFLTVHFHAVHGYAATHMRITHVLCFSSILPPPCSCIMSLISIMPA